MAKQKINIGGGLFRCYFYCCFAYLKRGSVLIWKVILFIGYKTVYLLVAFACTNKARTKQSTEMVSVF